MAKIKGRERTQKWYLKNEYEVMTELGLKATKGSGNGWVEKEDGQNDFVICQLKSTDKESYSIKQLDLEKLEYNAAVTNKIPMFLVQFLNNDSRYALVAIEDIPKLAEYITTGEVEKLNEGPLINLEELPKRKKAPTVKSSTNAREQYLKEQEKMWNNRKYNK